MKLFLSLVILMFTTLAIAQVPGGIAARYPVGTPLVLNTGSTNVTNSAWVQLVAATANSCSAVQIHNTGAQPIKLGVGGAGSEVDVGLMFPIGVTAMVPVQIKKGVRLAVESMGSTQSSGFLTLMCFQ